MEEKSILIVDDEKDILETLVTMLKQLDFNPFVALDGEKALDIIKNEKWLMRRDPFTRFVAVLQRVTFIWGENRFRILFKIDKDICNL